VCSLDCADVSRRSLGIVARGRIGKRGWGVPCLWGYTSGWVRGLVGYWGWLLCWGIEFGGVVGWGGQGIGITVLCWGGLGWV